MFEYSRFLILQIISKGGKFFFEIGPSTIMLATDYGDYVYLVSIAMLISSLISAGLPISLLRLVPEWSKYRKNEHIAPVIWDIQVIMFPVAIFILFLMFKNKYSFALLFAYSIFIFFYSLSQSYTTLYKAKGQIKKWLFYRETLFPLLVFAALSPLMFYGASLSIQAMINIIAMLSLLATALSIYKLRGLYRVVLNVRFPFRKDVVDVFKVSAPMFFTGFTYLVLSRIDIIMLEKYVDKEVLGGYNVVVRTTLQVAFVWQMLSSYYMPKIAQQFINEDMELVVKLNRKYIINSFVSTAIISIIYLFLVEYYSLGKYVAMWGGDMKNAMFILIAGQILSIVFSSYGYIILYIGKEKYCYVNSVIILASGIILNLVLIPLYGIQGSAYGTVIALLIGKVLEVLEVYYSSRRIYL